MDCGLISKKPRGLNAKCPKLDFPGIVFLKETRGPSPRVRGLQAAPVHGHRLGGGSPENGWNGAPVRGTSPWLREKGEETVVSLTGGKRGRRRVGHDRATVGNNRRRRRSVGWTLRTRKRAIEGGVSVVMAGGAPRPFIVAGEGHTGVGEGETVGSNSLNAIDGGVA
jgi:hypothetical protein